MRALLSRLDPRWYQIGALGFLLVYGLLALSFDVSAAGTAVILGTTLATQLACTKIFKLKSFEWKSALISGLGLAILLRSNHLWLLAVAAVLTILPKFIIRVRGKHIFNPTNSSMTFLLLIGAPIWVSAGQWGNAVFFAFLMMCIGSIVVVRAGRWDVAFLFIVFYCALIYGRSVWLGEPLTIPTHRLQSGALVMFTFHMISDPRTTPDSRAGRVLFAAAVAFGAFFVTFGLFRTNGLLWSLFVLSPLVPVLDRVLPGPRFTWTPPPAAAPKDAIPA